MTHSPSPKQGPSGQQASPSPAAPPPAQAASDDVRITTELVRDALATFALLGQFYTRHHAADNEVNYTVFHSAVEPTIPFPDYALRLNRHLDAGDDAMLLSLVLIGRYSQHTGMLPSVLTVHRLFLAALRVVTKTLHDITRSTASYARAGGIHLSELCRLERHMLDGARFRVYFTLADLQGIAHEVLRMDHRVSPFDANLAARAMGLRSPNEPSRQFVPGRVDVMLTPTSPPSVDAAGTVVAVLDGSLSLSLRPRLMSASETSLMAASSHTAHHLLLVQRPTSQMADDESGDAPAAASSFSAAVNGAGSGRAAVLALRGGGLLESHQAPFPVSPPPSPAPEST